jgi:hypothetical protein
MFDKATFGDHEYPLPAYWKAAKKIITGRDGNKVKANKLKNKRELKCFDFFFHFVGKRIDMGVPSGPTGGGLMAGLMRNSAHVRVGAFSWFSVALPVAVIVLLILN